MVSALYIVLGALFLIKLSLDVVRLRRRYRVSYGDGGFFELQTAIRVHGNAVECIPIALLLLTVMEMNGADIWILHVCGLLLFSGRVLHALGLRSNTLLWRKNGMVLTLLSLLLMAIINLIYLPWDLILTLH